MENCRKECPGSRETSEVLAASPEPDRVVTLVHGTFARCAPWMREGPLCYALKDNDPGNPYTPNDPVNPYKGNTLSGTTLFSRFCWTGKNSHRDRLQAGEALGKHLGQLTEKFKKARHFVVGHSHGGNVMLYAMKDKALAEKVSGIITLATPFITVRRRKLPSLVLFGICAIFLLGIIEACLHFWGPKAGEHPWGVWIAVLILIWLIGTVLSAGSYWRSDFSIGDLIKLFLRRENDIVRTELQGMKLTRDEESTGARQLENMLVARPLGDEAAMGLVVAQFLSWIQNRILTMLSSSVRNFLSGVGWFSWIWKFLIIIVLAGLGAKLLPYTVGELMATIDGSVNDWLFPRDRTILKSMVGGAAGLMLTGLLSLPVLFGLMSLMGLIVLLLAGFGFGPDAMFWNHFASTTAEASPPGSAHVYLQSPPPQEPGKASTGLAHSGIYTDPKVIDEITRWIKTREENLT